MPDNPTADRKSRQFKSHRKQLYCQSSQCLQTGHFMKKYILWCYVLFSWNAFQRDRTPKLFYDIQSWNKIIFGGALTWFWIMSRDYSKKDFDVAYHIVFEKNRTAATKKNSHMKQSYSIFVPVFYLFDSKLFDIRFAISESQSINQ
jgi:hypothetical protein